MRRLFAIISVFILFINLNIFGQGYIVPCLHCEPIPINDWGLVSQITIMKKFKEEVKGEFNVQSRILDNFKSLKAIMFEPGLKIKLSNHFALKSAFRFTLLPFEVFENSIYYKKYRLHIAGYYVWHKEDTPLRVQYRTRIEKEDFIFWRNRIKVAYKFHDVIKPYNSFEIFNRFNNDNFLDLYRYEAGVKWEMHESYNITFMYRHELYYLYDFYSSEPIKSKVQVFGIMFNYSI